MSIEPAVLAAIEAELEARLARHHTTLSDDQRMPIEWFQAIESYANRHEWVKVAAVAIAALESAARLEVLAAGPKEPVYGLAQSIFAQENEED